MSTSTVLHARYALPAPGVMVRIQRTNAALADTARAPRLNARTALSVTAALTLQNHHNSAIPGLNTRPSVMLTVILTLTSRTVITSATKRTVL